MGAAAPLSQEHASFGQLELHAGTGGEAKFLSEGGGDRDLSLRGDRALHEVKSIILYFIYQAKEG